MSIDSVWPRQKISRLSEQIQSSHTFPKTIEKKQRESVKRQLLTSTEPPERVNGLLDPLEPHLDRSPVASTTSLLGESGKKRGIEKAKKKTA